jgi:hypothetical protein
MDRQPLPDWMLRPFIIKSALSEIQPSARPALKRWPVAIVLLLVTIYALAYLNSFRQDLKQMNTGNEGAIISKEYPLDEPFHPFESSYPDPDFIP